MALMDETERPSLRATSAGDRAALCWRTKVGAKSLVLGSGDVVANRSAVTPPRVAQAWPFVLGASRPDCWCSASPPATRSARWSPHQEVSR
jgi:hypothetical protein